MVATVVACASSGDDTAADAPLGTTEGGIWYDRANWPHDGNPIETANFVVFGDSANLDARREVATVAEELWTEVLDEFSVEPAMLKFPEGQTKIELFAYRDPNLQDCTGCADYGWLVIYSVDHPNKPTGALYPAIMTHELVHALHFLLTGYQGRFDSWFTEGLAEAVSGGTNDGAIRGLDQFDDVNSTYGRLNPISFKGNFDESQVHHLYPRFHLAVEYLLDEDGHGRSLGDMRNLIIDVGEGSTFAAAFENHMGMVLDEYETRFFELIDNYLPQHRNPLFSPPWFAILSLAVAIIVLGTPAVVYRRGSTSAVEEPRRLTSIGFLAAMIISLAMLLVVFLAGQFLLGTTTELNNAVYESGRLRAQWIMVGYLAVSVALTSWAAHRWTHRSRQAYLVAPLVLVATVATLVAVGALLSP